MLQIQYSRLLTDATYREQVQEDFRDGFQGIPEPELSLAVAAYCFALAVPQVSASLSKQSEQELAVL
jgi:hypothetical protein